MMKFKIMLKEPLLQFLLAGAFVFMAYEGLINTHGKGIEDEITVNKQSLLMFIQYRTKAFNGQDAEARLAAMSPKAVDRLVDEYVREEALFREAMALGLDANDDVIRQRMIEKMEYLAEGLADAKGANGDGETTRVREGVSPEFLRRQAAIKNIVGGYTVSNKYDHPAPTKENNK